MAEKLKAKHRRTLERVFAHPLPANLKWKDLAALLEALGAEIEEREGSRLRIKLESGASLLPHRPHGAVCDKGSVATIRDWLRENEIEP